MGIGRMLGVFILCAVIMGLICIRYRGVVKERFEENDYEFKNLSYTIAWFIFSAGLWGIVMLVWLGIHLIVG